MSEAEDDDLIARVRARVAEASPAPDDGDDPSRMHLAMGRHLIEIPWLDSAPGDQPPPLLPPCDPADIDRAEAALGVPLPPLLRRLYTEVGEGGYGPGDGIVGLAKLLEEHESFAVELAEGQELGEWPAGLLPFCQLDQTLTACIDCSTPAGAIVGFEFDELDFDDPDTWEGAFSPRSPSLHDWLQGWLDGGHG
jgi:hypothetical protein